MWVRGAQSAGDADPDPRTAREVRAELQADRARLRALLKSERAPLPRALWLDPSYQAVLLYRWSSFFFQRRRFLLARLLWHLNLLLTGADLSPHSRIGPGLVIVHPATIVTVGRAGRDLTLRGHCGFGGGLTHTDIGAGPGLPVLGDGVTLDFSARVFGPVRVGNGARIGPGCSVTQDVPDGQHVQANPPAILARPTPPVRRAAAP